jgi:hypothetical protein
MPSPWSVPMNALRVSNGSRVFLGYKGSRRMRSLDGEHDADALRNLQPSHSETYEPSTRPPMMSEDWSEAA